MADKILTADSTTQALLSGSDTYYLHHDVSHVVSSGIAVYGVGIVGHNNIAVDGAVVALYANAIQFSAAAGSDAASFNVQIGEEGTVRSTTQAGNFAIRLDSNGGNIQVANLGEVTAEHGLYLKDGRTSVLNAGTITAQDGYGVWLAGGASGSVTNSGVIQGETGLRLGAVDANVTVINSGEILGFNGSAISVTGTFFSTIRLENTGSVISRTSYAFYAAQGGDLDNAGEVLGAVTFGAGASVLRNAGVIVGDVTGGDLGGEFRNVDEIVGHLSAKDGTDTLVNSGVITEDVDLGDGDGDVDNSGEIGGDLRAGGGIDEIRNTGEVGGRLLMGNGDNWVVNAGVVIEGIGGGSGVDVVVNRGSTDWISVVAGDDQVRNVGVVDDYVLMYDGENVLRNHGEIGGSVSGGSDADLVVSTGVIGGDLYTDRTADKVLLRGGLVGGDVNLGQGNDTFRATGGAEVLGMIRGQDDNDRILGSSEIDRIEGGGGFDTLKGRGGDDEIKGGAGDDTLVGGAGDDEMTGGINADEFRIGKHSGADTILDWEDGTDVLNLRKLGMTGGTKLGDVIAASENRIGGAVIIDLDDIGGDGSITVENWNTALMSVDDFIF